VKVEASPFESFDPVTSSRDARSAANYEHTDLKGLSGKETEQWCEALGLPAYRGRQIRRWFFKKLASSFDEMTNLPKDLRHELTRLAAAGGLERAETITSRDGTQKTRFRLQDGYSIESVLIPERGHFTLCISSQAGCAMGCRFCVTGRRGFRRDLAAGEILDQVIQVRRAMPDPTRLTNIVFMGMGEPLANYESVVRAIRNLTAGDGLNFSHRKVTLSTCGLLPVMKRLGRDVNVNLAVSLNAADENTRTFLMPVNRTYSLGDLIEACRMFPLPNRRMITFEYILIKDVNDADEDALNLARLLSGLKAKINLIPLNPHPDLDLAPSAPDRIQSFQELLIRRNFTAIIRKSKGWDISAACGQLSAEG